MHRLSDAELKSRLRMDPRRDYEDVRDAAQELDRRERIWRLYEAAVEPAPGAVHTASSRLAKGAKCLCCGKAIRIGQVYCDGGHWGGQRLRAHYDCVPSLGVDRESWMAEREAWFDQQAANSGNCRQTSAHSPL